MKNFNKIKLHKDIKNITKTGEKTVFNFAIVYKVKNLEDVQKLNIGILTSKKFGNAVSRNKARRRLIGAINKLKINSQDSVVFIPRNYILKIDFNDIVTKLGSLFI